MILLIGASDFTRERAKKGNSWENDLLQYLVKHIPNTKLLYTDTWEQTVKNVEIVYCFDCDRLRDHFNTIIHFYHAKNIPIVLLANDLFHYDLVVNNKNTKLCTGIISSVKMEKLQDQFRESFPDKYIGGISNQYINTDKFHSNQVEKIYDIVIYGTIYAEHETKMNKVDEEYFNRVGIKTPPSMYNFYPLRKRMVDLLTQNKKYKIKIIKSNLGCWDCPTRGNELSRIISQGYLSLATRSRSDRCMVKYFEISASDTVILGNVPSDFRSLFEPNMVVIDDTMPDTKIMEIIDQVLVDKQRLVNMAKIFGEYVRKNFGNNNLNTAKEFIDITNKILS